MIRQIKDFRTIFIALVFISISGLRVFAQPAVTGTSGTLSHGASVTISGSGFGSKPAAAPLKWDDFENGTLGADLTTLGYTKYNVGTGIFPTINNSDFYGQGSKSALKNITPNVEDFKGFYFNNFGSATEGYVSLMFKVDGDGSGQFKSVRLNAREPYHGNPKLSSVAQPSASWWYGGWADTNNNWHQYNDNYAPIKGQWNRMEYHWKLSNPGGTANGIVKTWVNLQQNYNFTNIVTRLSGDTAPIYSVLLPGMCSGATGAFKIKMDNIYIDNTIARVEIGNASTWSASTKREIQYPSAWSDTSISIKLNQGSLTSLTNSYLYVVDSSGNVNTYGYPLNGNVSVSNVSIPVSIPNPPTLISVQ